MPSIHARNSCLSTVQIISCTDLADVYLNIMVGLLCEQLQTLDLSKVNIDSSVYLVKRTFCYGL